MGDFHLPSAASPELQQQIDHVKLAIQTVLDSLISVSQDVSNDPIIKVATREDVPIIKDLATPSEGPRELDQLMNEAFTIFDHRMRVNHPRFMGFIPSPTLPVAWLGDVIASAYNALGASKLQASGPVITEKRLTEWLASRIGLPAETSGGIFVSGGSMANMMALVMARDRNVPPGRQDKAVAYMSDQTHFSVAKALRILGFQKHQIRWLASDDNFRMMPAELDKAIRSDREAGLVPFVVVATSGTTNTGAVDPLAAVKEVCNRYGVWMHVDGAYGASAALSASRSQIVAELSCADSISWDAHKWLFQTYSCGILLVRDKSDLVRSFVNEGEYLRDGAAIEDEEMPNFWNYTMELTRPAHRAMKLWFTLRALGTEQLGKLLDHGFELAEKAEEELRKLPGWEVTSAASMGVITFRYAPAGVSEEVRDEINASVSKDLISSNIAGILTTKVRGKVALRICALSPELGLETMVKVIAEADKLAKKLSTWSMQEHGM